MECARQSRSECALSRMRSPPQLYQAPPCHRVYNRSTQSAETCLFFDVALSCTNSSYPSEGADKSHGTP